MKCTIDFKLKTLEDMLVAKFKTQGHIRDYSREYINTQKQPINLTAKHCAMEWIVSQLFEKQEVNKQIKDRVMHIINKAERVYNDNRATLN